MRHLDLTVELLDRLKELAGALLDGDECWGDTPDNGGVYDFLPGFTVGMARRVATTIALAERQLSCDTSSALPTTKRSK